MTKIEKFLFDGLPVRGAIVRIEQPWQEVLARRASNTETGPYPTNVQQLLGEMVAAGVLMQAGIHFEGALVMQIQGSGPVRLAVAEVKSDLRLRATAQIASDAEISDTASLTDMLNQDGRARCAITLDADDKRPGHQAYQGIVSLQAADGEPLASLAAVLQQYMQQSEQLDSVLVLAANAQVAAGLLVQRVPIKGEANLGGALHETGTSDALGVNEDYNRIATLAASLKHEELLELDTSKVLHRLFWQESLVQLDTQGLLPHFGCQCSRERVSAMLRNLGETEVRDMLEDNKPIEVGCEFCGAQYQFDAVDVGQLFTPLATPPPDGVH